MNTGSKVVIGAGIAALTFWVLKKKGVIGKKKSIVAESSEQKVTYAQNVGTMKLGNTIESIIGSSTQNTIRYYS